MNQEKKSENKVQKKNNVFIIYTLNQIKHKLHFTD